MKQGIQFLLLMIFVCILAAIAGCTGGGEGAAIQTLLPLPTSPVRPATAPIPQARASPLQAPEQTPKTVHCLPLLLYGHLAWTVRSMQAARVFLSPTCQ